MIKTLSKTALSVAAVLSMSTGVAMAADSAMSSIINNAGEEIGTINIKQGPEGVLMNVDIKGLPAGAHGFTFTVLVTVAIMIISKWRKVISVTMTTSTVC